MRLLSHDFAGHPFAAELSRVLAGRGHVVTHGWCGGVTTGRGSLERLPNDPRGLSFVPVSDAKFERYSPVARLRGELAYGRKVASLVDAVRPHAIISANTPLAAQARLWGASRTVGARRVYWLQDFLGRGTRAVLHGRSPLLGATAGRAWEALEARLLRRSDHIVAISDDFVSELQRREVGTPVTVIENWTPLSEVTVRPKSSPWSREHDLASRPVAVYAGTLGLKHDPEHLVAIAQQLQSRDARLVVVTEGLGRDHLERRKADLQLDALHLMDFVPYESLPYLLGAADVCVVLLEADAGMFSVPSKVLTYLAAGRAIVGAMPSANLAARTIERAGGLVTAPGAYSDLASAVESLLTDPPRTRRLGEQARAFAERTFDVDRAADRIEAILSHS